MIVERVGDERLDPEEVLMKSFREVNTDANGLDIHIFEELPSHIQADIIEENEVIYTSHKYGMSEYFYNYRNLWEDQKHRNSMTKEELLAGL